MRLQKLIILIILITYAVSSKAQNNENKHISRNFKEEVKEIEKQIEGKVHKQDVKVIASSIGFYDKLVFNANQLITDRPDLENKIIEIANNLINSSNLKTPSKIKRVYISKLTNFNCSVTNQGTIYINIGLLAEIADEAALASIIGHEIIHFKNQDVLNRKIKSFNDIRADKKQKKISQKKWKFETDISDAEYSQNQETISDSLGAQLAFNAGYSLYSGRNNFLTFINDARLDGDANLRSGIGIVSKNSSGDEKIYSVMIDVLSSHPDNYNRYYAFDRYIKKFGENEKKTFKFFTENEFKKMNDWAKEAVIAQLLKNSEYQKCLEKSFLFYLFNPNNLKFVHGILESSRVIFILNSQKLKVGFLSENYNSKIIPKGQGILSNLKAFVLDSTKYKQISSKALKEFQNIPFHNYDDAFNYFADLAIENKCTECFLSIALRNSSEPELKKEFTEKYLNDPKAEKKEYARAYLDNKLVELAEKSNKNLLLIDKFYRYERSQLVNFISDINLEEDIIDFKSMIEKNINPDSCKVLFFNDFQNNKELIDKVGIAENFYLNNINKFGRSDCKTLWEISPDLWELFAVNGYKVIHTFSYINLKGYNPISVSFFPYLLKTISFGSPDKTGFNMISTFRSSISINKKKGELTHESIDGYVLRKPSPDYLLNTVYKIIQ